MGNPENPYIIYLILSFSIMSLVLMAHAIAAFFERRQLLKRMRTFLSISDKTTSINS